MSSRKKNNGEYQLEHDTNGFLRLLNLMVEQKASDLHLRVPSSPVFRIDGTLVPQEDLPPLTPDYVDKIFYAVSTPEQKKTFARELALDFTYSIPGLARFRISAIRQRGTISLAFRLIPIKIPSIDELELPQICKELILRPRGLILITGPSGSGKSTTLASMINHLNENYRRNVITIEDPVEYLHSNNSCIIAQRELGGDTISFSAAVIHGLRHDPDVIVIGEVRDLDTMSTAITAAETGHLVLGTLHTIDVVQTIDRVVDLFPHGQQRQVRLQLSQIIEAIISQTLVSRIGGGRVAAMEIMVANGATRNLMRDSEKVHELPRNMEVSSKEEGMQTLDQALTDLVKRGVVSREDAIVRSMNPARLNQLLNDMRMTSTRF